MTIRKHKISIQIAIKTLIILSLVLLVSGCLNRRRNTAPRPSANLPTDSITNQDQLSQSAPAPAANTSIRFQNQTNGSRSVVESAMELSKKYAEVTEENSNLKITIKDLSLENSTVKQQLAATQETLAETKKELDESYHLMIKMRTELNNWKVDILGYRDEMRLAQSSQLKATLQIIKLLGGQTEDEPAIDNQKITESSSDKTEQ